MRATTFSRVSPLTEIGFDLCEFIPAGMTSSGKYIRTRQHDGSLWEPHSRAVYLRSDVDAILSEYRDMVVAGTSTSEIDSWKAEKSSENRTLLAQCARIEEFQKKVAAEQPRHREARAGFFAAQGANLTPPLGIDVMEKIMAFKMSLDSNHEPTMRSWGDLKKKLLPHRAAAEELLHLIKVNQRFRAFGEPSLAIDNFRSLHSLRSRAPPSKSLQPEQLYVINLGRQQLTKCKDRAVADADLVLLVLKGVFDEYQCLPTAAKPYGTNADNSRGIYRLTLDDARMIVQHVIEPEVQSWNDALRSREVLAKFKCVGCVRKDCTTRYTFDSVFQHIHEKHSIYVSEGEDFHKLYRPFDDTILEVDFPWYTVEWPRNLPVAASHQEVSKEKKWLADAEVNYVPLSSPETPSVFLDRRACVPAGIGSSDFEGNLCYAATKLRPTTLSVACQLRIVLQYALDRYVVDHGIVKPSLADFMACLPKLQAANEDFTLTFSCGVCKQNPDIPQSAIHTRPETLTKLKDHFDKIHHTSDWTLSFVDSPSDTQLASILQDADVRLKEEKRATLRRQASLAKNPRKKADPNAQMILQKPEAMTVFDELFPRVEVEA